MVVFVLSSALGQPAQRPNDSAAEAFKSFLASRPVIEEIIYGTKPLFSKELVQSYMDLERPVDTNHMSVCLGRWQPGAFLKQYGGTLQDYDKGNKSGGFVGMFAGQYWQMSPPVIEVFQVEIPRVQSIKMVAGDLLQTLNFGIPNLAEGSLKWTGNQFAAQTTSGDRMDGALTLDNDGYPKEVYCKVAGSEWDYLLYYTYSPASGAGSAYPSRIITTIVKSGKTNALLDTEIFALRTGTTSLASNLIAPEYLLPVGARTLILNSNRVQFLKRANGEVINLNTAPRVMTGTQYLRRTKALLYLALVLLALLPAILIAKRRNPGYEAEGDGKT